MSLWRSVFRADGLSRARRAFKPALRARGRRRDVKMIAWLDELRADAKFGWRQLMKHKGMTAAAVLSLGLAIGACTAAFRLIDALLLRPLPVAEPGRLYSISRIATGSGDTTHPYDTWAYPDFRLMREATKSQAELIAVSNAERVDLTYKSDAEMERVYLQYVSGWMFDDFGLRPAVGRLLRESDDKQPRSHPNAVLSEGYWRQRFGSDKNVVGQTFRMGGDVYEIVGVIAGPFTGTEAGTMTEVFVPTMMNPWVTRDDATWFRTFVRVQPGVMLERLRQRLDATSRGFERERSKGFTAMDAGDREKFIDQTLLIDPAAAGVSGLQKDYRRALEAIAVLVALVLLIACANVANLLTAKGAARSREMALRVSIGAGRRRLLQLVLVEGAWLAVLSSIAGALFAWWSAPFVVSKINPPDHPAQILLPADWRMLAFGLSLAIAVTILFGLAPALRASEIKPASAIKGDEPHVRARLMNGLVALQAAFCFVVIFGAGLFATTFEHLSHRPIGFSTRRLLALETVSQRPQPAEYWDEMARHLREVAGVEKVAFAGWALPGSHSWNGFVSVNGAKPGPALAYFLPVSPGWIGTLKMRLIDGRDFRESDTRPGSIIINQTFAKTFYPGQNPIGQYCAKDLDRFRVVGVVEDAPYRDIRGPIVAVGFVPFHVRGKDGALQPSNSETFIVRTASDNPLAMAASLRSEVARFQPLFRVSNIWTQQELVDVQTVRERLLAMLGLFFAAVALLLAGVGLYGVLDYSVLQRRREFGIRRAIGARAGEITRLVTVRVLVMVVVGAAAGVAAGLLLTPYVASLLYEVKPNEWSILALPVGMIFGTAAIAALPAVIRAIQIDPAEMLRSE